jgi:hypothetical protein
MCCDGRSVTAKWNEPTSGPHQCPRDVSVNIASTLDSLSLSFTHTLSFVLSRTNNLSNHLTRILDHAVRHFRYAALALGPLSHRPC